MLLRQNRLGWGVFKAVTGLLVLAHGLFIKIQRLKSHRNPVEAIKAVVMLSRNQCCRSIVTCLSTTLCCPKNSKNTGKCCWPYCQVLHCPCEVLRCDFRVMLPVPDCRHVPLNGAKPVTMTAYSLLSSL